MWLIYCSTAWQLFSHVWAATEGSHSSCRQWEVAEGKEARWSCQDHRSSVQITWQRFVRPARQWTVPLKLYWNLIKLTTKTARDENERKRRDQDVIRLPSDGHSDAVHGVLTIRSGALAITTTQCSWNSMKSAGLGYSETLSSATS